MMLHNMNRSGCSRSCYVVMYDINRFWMRRGRSSVINRVTHNLNRMGWLSMNHVGLSFSRMHCFTF